MGPPGFECFFFFFFILSNVTFSKMLTIEVQSFGILFIKISKKTILGKNMKTNN